MNEVKNYILKLVNAPESGILSSQTLYETLFYLINTYHLKQNIKNKTKIKEQARELAEFLCQYQLQDGGFDLGYDFIFGRGLNKKNKKEGTSPELLSITALALYYQTVEKNDLVLESLVKGLDWIFSRVISSDNGYAIPYAPDSYEKIHITNATSFCLSALASCYPIFDGELKLKIEMYVKGMYQFMYKELEFKNSSEAYWPYFYMHGDHEEMLLTNDKVDNYHISQQVYHHALAQTFIPDDTNIQTLKVVLKYLKNLVDADGFVPYSFSSGKYSDKVDVWGFSSLIGCFSISSTVLSDDTLKVPAEKICNYLIKYCFNGEYFSPIILNHSKARLDDNFYPRSDAWVIHALSEYSLIGCGDENIRRLSDNIYHRIQVQGYYGLENHTITARKKLFAFVVNLIKSGKISRI